MKKIFISLAISIIAFFIASPFFNTQHSIILAIVALLVALWTNEGLPLGVVSLLPIMLFPTFGVLSTNDVTSNYSKSIIFLFLGGFLVAIATEKINLHKIIANSLLSIFPNSVRGVVSSLAITSALLSSVISNTTTALLLIPIAMFISDNIEIKKRLVLAVAYGASIGGIITPIGTPPNLIYLGFMDDNHLQTISFVKWMALTIPLAVVMLVFISFILSFGIKDKLEVSFEKTKMNFEQKRLTYILIGLVVLLLVNSPIKPYWGGLGLNEKLILLGFGILMFMPKIGFLTWRDSKKIPFEIIFLFGAGFSIAMAFSKSGLAAEIATYLQNFADMPILFLLLIVATFVTFTTEVTSNTALISIALPIIYSLAQMSGANEPLILMVATIAASYAFMLPIATPPNAIAMSSGALKVSDMAKFGIILNIVGVISVTLVAYFVWSKFL
jgi:sodium-dependent dicarboxylate transporter 2/3/5